MRAKAAGKKAKAKTAQAAVRVIKAPAGRSKIGLSRIRQAVRDIAKGARARETAK